MSNKSTFGGKRKQAVKVLTEANEIIDATLNVERRYMTTKNSLEAWGLDRIQQVADKVTGNVVQFISEVSHVPLTLWPADKNVKGGKGDGAVKSNIDRISSEAVDDELAYIDERKRKNNMTLYLAIIAALLTLGVLIFVYMALSKSSHGIKLG